MVFYLLLPVEIPASEKCRGVCNPVWLQQLSAFAHIPYVFNIWWWKDGNISHYTRSGSNRYWDSCYHDKHSAGETSHTHCTFIWKSGVGLSFSIILMNVSSESTTGLAVAFSRVTLICGRQAGWSCARLGPQHCENNSVPEFGGTCTTFPKLWWFFNSQ